MEKKRPWTNLCTVSVFAWRDRGKSPEFSVRVAGVSAEIRNEHFPNTSLERYIYTTLLGINDAKWRNSCEVSAIMLQANFLLAKAKLLCGYIVSSMNGNMNIMEARRITRDSKTAEHLAV
jgi:hypothetical protein